MSEAIQGNGESKALATVEETAIAHTDTAVGFHTERGFVALQRVANAFASSALVPDVYRGKQGVANCIIAIEMAHRMGASPLMVMQNLYLVHGRPSWASQFLIASFNNCGRFTAIKYRWSGERGKDSFGCQAYATEKATGDAVEGPVVTLTMAKAEGWFEKKGSKWQTIPDLMMRYRAATFLVRTTAPELTMGLRTVDESEDIAEPAPPPTKRSKAAEVTVAAKAEEPPHDAETLPEDVAALVEWDLKLGKAKNETEVSYVAEHVAKLAASPARDALLKKCDERLG